MPYLICKWLTHLAKEITLIAARATTEERLRTDRLMMRLNLNSYGQLVGQLPEEKAAALEVQ